MVLSADESLQECAATIKKGKLEVLQARFAWKKAWEEGGVRGLILVGCRPQGEVCEEVEIQGCTMSTHGGQ